MSSASISNRLYVHIGDELIGKLALLKASRERGKMEIENDVLASRDSFSWSILLQVDLRLLQPFGNSLEQHQDVPPEDLARER